MSAPWIRRPVTITIWLIVAVAVLSTSPFLLGIAAIASRTTRQPRPLILARLLVTYFCCELVGLLGCGLLWFGSGAGLLMRSRPVQMAHWRLLRWYIGELSSRALSLLAIKVEDELDGDCTRALEAQPPVLIFSRHAGPGDTIFLIDRLMSRYARRPSVVFKQDLVLDPCIDLLAHRLPHAMLDTADREASEAQIEAVAAGLGEKGALLLFPEGANFTPERRRAAIVKLGRKGEKRAANIAKEMSHVLPPRPTGALAALNGNPAADVVFVAHTGLGLACTPPTLWRDLPLGRKFQVRAWRVSARQIPRDPSGQMDWLNDQWKLVDEWIDEQGRVSS